MSEIKFVKVTIQLKSPVGYDYLDAIRLETGRLNRFIDTVPSNESIIQGPRIIYETCAPPAPPRNNLGLTGVRVRRDLLFTTSGDYSMGTYLMLKVPIPTSAFSNYLRVTLTREAGSSSTIHFSSSLYTLIIVDRERRYLHSVVCNMREEPPSIQVIVPYEAPPVGERAFQLGFSVYLQTAGLMILDDQEVTKLQTRSYDEFLTFFRTYHLRNVGNSLILVGPEARPRPEFLSPTLAPAA